MLLKGAGELAMPENGRSENREYSL